MRPTTTQHSHSQGVQSRGVSPRTATPLRTFVAEFTRIRALFRCTRSLGDFGYQHSQKCSGAARRAAFTLIELMIAVSILLLLTYITSKVVRDNLESDRVASGARRIQSYLQGARDRAIFSNKTLNPGPRGVRFLRDPNGPFVLIPDPNDPSGKKKIKVLTAITSMIYIGPPQVFSGGQVEIIDDLSMPARKRRVKPLRTDWDNLRLRKFLLNGARIRIPAVIGSFYTMIYNQQDNDPNEHFWELTKDFPQSKRGRVDDYELFLEPAVLPNQEPRLLPRNVVIDVRPINPNDPLKKHSVIPGFWNGDARFRNRMDILFSPRGTIIGRSAVRGHIHLVVTDLADAEQGRYTGQRDIRDAQGNVIPGKEGKEGDEKIVTINTRTGSVTVHSVDITDDKNNNTNANTPDGIPDDPFRFAETGEES